MQKSAQVHRILTLITMAAVCASFGFAETTADQDTTDELVPPLQSVVHAAPLIEQPDSCMPGFSWVIPDELAAMPLPGRSRSLAEDASFLHLQGIHTLISLTETVPDREILAAAGITNQVHIPIEDFTAPTVEQIDEFVTIVKSSAANGEAVGVHCTAGLGRSGTMAAAYLVATGASATDAINTLRQLRPGSIETEPQEAAVQQYEEYLSQQR